MGAYVTKQYPDREWLLEWFDYRDGWLYWKKRRGKASAGSKAGTKQPTTGYITIGINVWAAHRLIWIWHFGAIERTTQIDHINRTKDDNRIENLRLVSPSLNRLNSDPSRRPLYDLPEGVHNNDYGGGKISERSPFKAIFRKQHLGAFATVEEASDAYQKARRTYLSAPYEIPD